LAQVQPLSIMLSQGAFSLSPIGGLPASHARGQLAGPLQKVYSSSSKRILLRDADVPASKIDRNARLLPLSKQAHKVRLRNAVTDTGTHQVASFVTAAGAFLAAQRAKLPESAPHHFAAARLVYRCVALVVASATVISLFAMLLRGSSMSAVGAFFLARPFERAALLWTTGSVLGSCEAASRVKAGGRLRSMYIALIVAACFSLADPVLAPATEGVALRTLWSLMAVLVGAADLACVAAASLAIRFYKRPGPPIEWQEVLFEKGRPLCYAIALACCAATLSGSLWHFGRCVMIIAAMDELRRASRDPLQLVLDEAQELNRGVLVWAAVALVEAMIISGVVASMGSRLGYFKIGAFSLAFIGAPAMALWAAWRGWIGGIEAISERRHQPVWQLEQYFTWKRLGAWHLEELEVLFLQQMQLGGENGFRGAHNEKINGKQAAEDVNNFIKVPDTIPMRKEFFYRLKVRLMTAESDVPKLQPAQVNARLQEGFRQIGAKKENDSWRLKYGN